MIKFPKEIKNIIAVLQANRFEGYAAGECVRDSIAGLEPYAWDIATNAGIDDLKQLFPSCKVISERYSTIRLEYLEDVIEKGVVVDEKGLIVDVYRYRNSDGSFAGTVDDDLLRRDFTCDAIADSGSRVVNPLNGMDDLRSKLLKANGNPNVIFEKNPLKILKVINIVSYLGLDISKDVYEAICTNRAGLAGCDMQRLGEELYDIMGGGNAGKALSMIADTGLLGSILGENVTSSLTSKEKSDMGLLCRNIDKTAKNPERRLGLLFGLLSKKKAIPAIKALKFDESLEQKLVDAASDMHDLYSAHNAERLKDFIYDHGKERFEYLLNLEKAMHIAFELDNDRLIRSTLSLLDQIRAGREPIFVEDLCIDAKDLIDEGIAKDRKEACKLLGYIAEHCHYNVKDNTRKKCLRLAKRFKIDPINVATRRMKWLR